MRKIRAAVPIALCAVAGLVGLPALTAAQSPTPNPRPLPPDNYGTPTPTPTPTYHIGQKDTSSLPTASPTPVPEQTAQAVPESVLKLPQLYRPPSHSALASVARVLRGRGRPLSVRKILKRRIRHRLSLPCGRIDLSDGTTGNPLGDAKAARLVFGFKNGTHGHLQYWVLAQPKVCTKRWGRSEKCYSLQRRQGAPAV
jgi:hypothetical protein